jgi:hypothetical protein
MFGNVTRGLCSVGLVKNVYIGTFDVSRAGPTSLLRDGEEGAFVHVLAEAATHAEFEEIGRQTLHRRGVLVLGLSDTDNIRAIEQREDVPSEEFRYLSTFLTQDGGCVVGDVFAYEEDDE